MRAPVFAAIVVAAVGCRSAVDVASLERRLGPDGAAEELRFRLSSHAGDAALWSALATVEAGRGRGGAAIEAYQRAEALGAPLSRGSCSRAPRPGSRAAAPAPTPTWPGLDASTRPRRRRWRGPPHWLRSPAISRTPIPIAAPGAARG